MKKERRWLKTAIASSFEQHPALPWQRLSRLKPAPAKPSAPAPRPAVAG